MAARPFQPRFEDLPATIPVFPLAGALLLPDGRLPLNIFEPRYLAMVEDALGARRLIGMIQPADPAESTEDRPALYDTGCVGRIASFAETNDGRLQITLVGVSRFRVRREVEGVRGYRRVEADWAPFRSDLDPIGEVKLDRKRLMAALRAYLKLHEMEVDWAAIEGTADAALSIVLPMSCPFEPREKQAMLECATPGERGRTLITLMEMALAEAKSGASIGVKQ
jgi:Lon protease-like protein